MLVFNKKARYNFSILEEFCAGIQLTSSEVKSLHLNGANFNDSFCYLNDGEVFIRGLYIPKYKNATFNNHNELRDRKLLLTKREILKIKKESSVPGISIVPLGIIVKNGKFKLAIAIAKGKKLWNKKEDEKERDIKREVMRDFNIKV